MHRVQKILSNRGYCSRRKAEILIEQGLVKVNGKKITIGNKAELDAKITVKEKIVPIQKKVCLLFHKPIGCVTALKDKQYKTVMDYIKIKERVFPIGRLDYNTSGLLLLTNDGDFANSIMHPRYEIKKTYLVELVNPINNQDLKVIRDGVELEDGKTRPARVKKHNPKLLEISIHEGKNRIVRRMFKEIEHRIVSLKRVKVGKLDLGELEVGKYRILTEKDKKLIFL